MVLFLDLRVQIALTTEAWFSTMPRVRYRGTVTGFHSGKRVPLVIAVGRFEALGINQPKPVAPERLSMFMGRIKPGTATNCPRGISLNEVFGPQHPQH